MTAPARLPVREDPVDAIAAALARALARQHHASSARSNPESHDENSDLRPLFVPAAEG